LVLSMIFNYIILAFWRGDYGMCELGRSPGRLLVGVRSGPGDEANGRRDKKKKGAAKDFDAILLVRAQNANQARPSVERFLSTAVGRFQLAEVEENSKGQGVLKYLVRMGKRTNAQHLEDALLASGAPNIMGARVH